MANGTAEPANGHGEYPQALYPTQPELEAAFGIVRHARVPHVPDVVLQIRAEVGREDADPHRIADLVALDPALTGNLLRTVNSAAFGGLVELDSVHQAVIRLGVAQVANLITAELLAHLAEDDVPAVREAWESTAEVAKAAMVIASHVQDVGADEAYLFGMLHDVGNILFARVDPALSQFRTLAIEAPVSVLPHERARIGTDHATVGFLFARHWRLPDYFALAIYHHHAMSCADIDDPHIRSLIAIIKLATYLTSLHLRDLELPEMVQYRMAAKRELMLSDEVWEELRQDALSGALTQ
jgi:HD-like signal output (HDOD) protein